MYSPWGRKESTQLKQMKQGGGRHSAPGGNDTEYSQSPSLSEVLLPQNPQETANV